MIVGNHSPADILAEALVTLGLAAWGNVAAWTMSVGSMPEAPANRVSLSDTTPKQDGRLMVGTVIEHPGIQVRVRATKQPVGWLKASSIAAALDNMKNVQVVLEGRTYTIQNASRSGGVIPLGPELETGRLLWTINATLTLREETP